MPTSITEKVLAKHYGKQDLRFFEEENEPVNPKLWAKAKSLAEEKFDTYPSYEANNWTLRWYESKGGEWWITEEGLRDWFGKSKSKDGKSGWVNVVTGGTCASDKPGEGTPKCVSSAKRASMSKSERLSAQRRKKAADPGQQQKSGAAKPTYVPTDKKKAVKEEADKKGKSSGTKDACYHKVKARYRVWPSAYASGALVKCRKKGADNWGNSTKKEGYEWLTVEEFAVEACWAGYEKKGMKTMFGKRYPNCVKKTKKEEVELVFTEEERRHLSRLQLKMAKRMHEMDPKKKRAVADRLKKMKVNESLDESMRLPMEFGNVYEISLNWRGMFKMAKIFFPTIKKPSKKDVTAAIQKIWPGSSVYRYVLSTVNRGDSYLVAPDPKSKIYAEFGEETVDDSQDVTDRYNRSVQRRMRDDAQKSRTDQSEKHDNADKLENRMRRNRIKRVYGEETVTEDDMKGMSVKSGHKRSVEQGAGLTKQGVRAYRRRNPGSKLQTAVTTPPSKLKPGSKAAKRRKSFCARSRGWTGERGKAARRRWNC